MTLKHVFYLAEEYLLIGGILVFLAVTAFIVIRAIVDKKRNREHRKINLKRLVWWVVFLVYIFVVAGATMLNRGDIYGSGTIQPLFYSYKLAWIDWAGTEWRNIILNILMFVPFGFLLPCGIKWFRKFYRTYAAGFLFSLFIELSQKIFKIGIFEPDDLFNNTLGAMIGFGLFVLTVKLFFAERKNIRPVAVLLANIPLALTLVAFAAIFITYSAKELGNNNNRYVKVYDTDLLNISGKEFTDDTRMMAPVYKLSILSHDETRKLAEELFVRFDGGCDIYFESFYDNEAWFRSKGPNGVTQLVVKYKGGMFEYENMELYSEDAVSFSEKEVKEVLAKFGYEIGETAEYYEYDDNRTLFYINEIVPKTSVTDGFINVSLSKDKQILSLHDSVLVTDYYKDFELISEAEAYNQLKEGRFKRYGNSYLNIEVTDCNLTFSPDSKGFYQPNYNFEVIINGKEAEIVIPALIQK